MAFTVQQPCLKSSYARASRTVKLMQQAEKPLAFLAAGTFICTDGAPVFSMKAYQSLSSSRSLAQINVVDHFV